MTRQGAREAIFRGPGEGRRIPVSEGLTLKASAEETNGSIGFLEATSEPGFGPSRHVHHSCEELFYILGGTFDFLVGERRVRALPGSFVLVPRAMVHAPKVVGPEPGRVLIAFVPGGQEGAFDEFAELAAALGGTLDQSDDRVQAILTKYDSEIVGPPL